MSPEKNGEFQAGMKENRGSPEIQEFAWLNEATYSHLQFVKDELKKTFEQQRSTQPSIKDQIKGHCFTLQKPTKD